MASEPPKDPQPEAVDAAPVAAVEAAPAPAVEAVPVAAVEAVPVVAVDAAPAEAVEAVPVAVVEAVPVAVEPAPPALPAAPVSAAKEWAAALALTIVLGLIAFEFLAYLRNVGN